MYTFRTLGAGSELEAFRDQFCAELERRSKGELRLHFPAERLAAFTRVVGVFRGERLVAGYVIHDGPEFALLRVIPDEPREAWLRTVDRTALCELNLIWRNAGIGHVAFALVVWPRIIGECVTSGCSLILGSGYDNPLNRWYAAMGPDLVYAGPSATSGLHVYIYAYTRPKLVATYFASFVDAFVRPRRRA